jgi:hemophore-related protein
MICQLRMVVGAVAVCFLGTVAAAAAPSLTARAAAAPCTAAGFATTASGVLSASGDYLDSHPGANDVLTNAAAEAPADARTMVRGYFFSHPGEFLELQNIGKPMTDLADACPVKVSPQQLAALFEAMQTN